MEILFLLLVLGILGVPFVLTGFNVMYCFKEEKNKSLWLDLAILLLGAGLTILLYIACNFKDYWIALEHPNLDGLSDYHAPILWESMPTILTIMGIAIFCYGMVRIKKLKLSPLKIVGCMSGMFLGIVLCVVWIIQISKNIGFFEGFFLIFPFNYCLCCFRICSEVIKNYEKKEETQSSILGKLEALLEDSKKWPLFAFFLAIPMLMIVICLLALFGQRPDAFLRAFWQTSEWTLSTEISPPPVEVDAHYLCTVSLKGDKELVKPLRFGIRKGQRIVVNRQLCVANAFEELIQEKVPRIHRFIRHVYDTYGFPLSQYIHSAKQADVVYLLMKPFEYFFVLVLYWFDKEPENRIARQYLPINKQQHMVK